MIAEGWVTQRRPLRIYNLTPAGHIVNTHEKIAITMQLAAMSARRLLTMEAPMFLTPANSRAL
jgi:hypothetical protein